MPSRLACAILSCYVVEGEAWRINFLACRKINYKIHAHYRRVHIFQVFERVEIFEFNISLIVSAIRVRVDVKMFSINESLRQTFSLRIYLWKLIHSRDYFTFHSRQRYSMRIYNFR